MEVMLEQGAYSDADLLRAVACLSGDEFLQVINARQCSAILPVLGRQLLLLLFASIAQSAQSVDLFWPLKTNQ